MAPATGTEHETTETRPVADLSTETVELLPVRDDLIVGIRAIAAELGVTKRKANYWHESGVIPTFKLRGSVCARRSELDAALRFQPRPVAPAAPRPQPDPAGAADEHDPTALRCKDCGARFPRPPKGRRPLRCPDHRGARR